MQDGNNINLFIEHFRILLNTLSKEPITGVNQNIWMPSMIFTFVDDSQQNRFSRVLEASRCMRGFRKFNQRGSNFDNFYFS